MRRALPGLLLILLSVVAAGTLAATPIPAGAQPAPTPTLGTPTAATPSATTIPSATATATPSPTRTISPTATPAASMRPDACEPNDTDAQACALLLDTVSGPFTFVPETDRDVYVLDLPDDPAIQTVVTVRATAGLDLFLSARQGPTLLASGAISLTLAPAIHGPVLLRVENRDPRPSAGESYRIEVRREIAPRAAGMVDLTGAPDALENNWSFATAATIAVGVVYDLTLVCPEARPDACPGGDHDYLRVPVKAGVAYRIATFDLDPGVDTVVEVFWQHQDRPVAGNDDYAPGGLLSALTWVAPADGLADIRVAPRNGGLTPQLVSPTHAAYRFVVAPVASELARKLEPTLRQQANIPTPTATAAASAAGGGSAAGTSGGTGTSAGVPGSQEQIASGAAIITRATVLRHEPRPDSTALADLPAETRVAVRGPVRGLWVSIAADASILPGWVLWSDLRRIDANAPLPTSTGVVQASAVPAGAAPVQQPSAA
ncbi:hypothetical protein HGA89_08230, partial [bacterium]|nr:hypothetical protein [bacterium]